MAFEFCIVAIVTLSCIWIYIDRKLVAMADAVIKALEELEEINKRTGTHLEELHKCHDALNEMRERV